MLFAECRVTAVRDLGPEYYQLVLEKPRDVTFTPGQFVHVKDKNSPDLLRRPFSVASETHAEFTLLIKEVGRMSGRLRNMTPGDMLDVLGPLGKGFDISGKKKAVLIGGGVGIAPLLRLSQIFEETGREHVCLLGFRDACEPAELFHAGNVRIHRETVDSGFVTHFLEDMLDESIEVFACGPLPMLKTVWRMCMEKGVSLQLSLEERMACGVGSCIGCAVAVKGAQGRQYKKVCKDGPVFWGEELAWE